MLRGAAAAEAVQVVGTPRLRRLGQPARTAFWQHGQRLDMSEGSKLADNRKKDKGE
jgi:hypothetical protein